jgi:hypothetical protein
MSIHNPRSGNIVTAMISRIIVNERRIPTVAEVRGVMEMHYAKEDPEVVLAQAIKSADLTLGISGLSVSDIIKEEMESVRRRESFRRKFRPTTWIRKIRQFFCDLERETRPESKS